MDVEIFNEDLHRIDNLVQELNGKLVIKYFKNQNYWRGSIEFDDRKYFFQINYIQVYPLFPPSLFCFEDDSYSKIWIDNRWRSHSYRDGHLCLFTSDKGESSWSETYRIDEVLKKFLTLLELTKKDTISPKHTSEFFTIGDYATPGEVYINSDFFQKLQKMNTEALHYYAMVKYQIPPIINCSNDLPIIAIFTINDPEFSAFPQKGQILCKFFSDSKFNSLKDALIEDTILKANKFLEFCNENQIVMNNIDAFLFGNKEDTSAPAFFIKIRLDFQKYQMNFCIVSKKYSFLEAIFVRESHYLSENFTLLENKKVLIIGLGTLGSKIAVELAMNGVKNLFLFDNDYYKPENVARGMAPYYLIGKSKAFVIEQIIRGISPQILVRSYGISPINPLFKSQFIELLKMVDLVICAIDAELDEIEIHQLCIENKVTAIYTIALDNGKYGRIYRVVPGKTACTECIKKQITMHPEVYPALNDPNHESHNNANNFNFYEHPGIPGINAFIWEIAIKTVQFSLYTLAGETKLKDFFPDFESDHFLISNTKGWIFEKAYQIKYFDFKKLKNCPVCGRLREKINNKIREKGITSKLMDKYVS